MYYVAYKEQDNRGKALAGRLRKQGINGKKCEFIGNGMRRKPTRINKLFDADLSKIIGLVVILSDNDFDTWCDYEVEKAIKQDMNIYVWHKDGEDKISKDVMGKWEYYKQMKFVTKTNAMRK